MCVRQCCGTNDRIRAVSKCQRGLRSSKKTVTMLYLQTLTVAIVTSLASSDSSSTFSGMLTLLAWLSFLFGQNQRNQCEKIGSAIMLSQPFVAPVFAWWFFADILILYTISDDDDDVLDNWSDIQNNTNSTNSSAGVNTMVAPLTEQSFNSSSSSHSDDYVSGSAHPFFFETLTWKLCFSSIAAIVWTVNMILFCLLLVASRDGDDDVDEDTVAETVVEVEEDKLDGQHQHHQSAESAEFDDWKSECNDDDDDINHDLETCQPTGHVTVEAVEITATAPDAAGITTTTIPPTTE